MKPHIAALLGGAAFTAAFALSGEAKADKLVFEYDREFSGADSPESTTTPWLRATFEDVYANGAVDYVKLTLEELNLTDAEFAPAFYFNLSEAISFSVDASRAISPTEYDLVSGVTPTGLFYDPANTDTDFKADGDGFFDIRIDFANQAFGVGSTSVIHFTLDGLRATDFNYLSENGNDPQKSALPTAVKIQGIGPTDNGSGWMTGDQPPIIEVPPPDEFQVPEPASLTLLGFGIAGLGLAGVVRSRRRRDAA